MNPFDQESKDGGLQLSPNSTSFLESTAKWARFLSILGFIGIGFMVLAALMMFAGGAMFSERASSVYGSRGVLGGAPLGLIGVVYLFMAALYFFPVLYLNKFASKMLNAITMRDSMTLESSFEQLRNHYRFVGIITIVMIGLYVLGIMAMVMGGIASGGFR
ncbi:MAG TPA: hypothetical protein VHS96_13600 [Bacteroidia bacterium]|nr:hypothetical protein [Bacteroidia bacterium]